jgi:hypothetical protein
MGTKMNPGAHDCYMKAAPDEPMFILLGRDKHAPQLVSMWCTLRAGAGEDPAKVEEARQCARDMIKYLRAHGKEPDTSILRVFAVFTGDVMPL